MGFVHNTLFLGVSVHYCNKRAIRPGLFVKTPVRTDLLAEGHLVKILAGTNLTMGRKIKGIVLYGLLNLGFNAVFVIRFTPVCLEQGINTTFFNCGLVPIESITRQARDLASFGYITQLFCQVQQTNFVCNYSA